MATKEYEQFVIEQRDLLFNNLPAKIAPEELAMIRGAFEFANSAHTTQKRKSGEPYITHPIAVARIVSEELKLGTASIIAALLHDVVEDTPLNITDIKTYFNSEVVFLVKVLTKEKKQSYEMSKQLDNFKQMLTSINFDIRALLIKLADRLHNMRTLSSMETAKQVKIASETGVFYAPLANRLGLYNLKSELENLSFRFRSPQEYARLERKINSYMQIYKRNIDNFIRKIEDVLKLQNLETFVEYKNRSVYAIWRKMERKKQAFKELENIYIVNIVFKFDTDCGLSEKQQTLRIYSALTDIFKDRPSSLMNYVDSPKDNGYQSLHCQIMNEIGSWTEIHIFSEEMYKNAGLGCIAEKNNLDENIWITKFKRILKNIVENVETVNFVEDVVTEFYQDDIIVFTPKGEAVNLPKNSIALDFAYEISPNIGNYSKAARINGKLSSVKTVLKRGDRVEIVRDLSVFPRQEWLSLVKTYKARQLVLAALTKRNSRIEPFPYELCSDCRPLPGDEVIGFKKEEDKIEVHKRNCKTAILCSASEGDTIINIELPSNISHYYDATMKITGIDRTGLLYELIQVISKILEISIVSLKVDAVDEIMQCELHLRVQSAHDISASIASIEKINGIEDVWRE